MFITCSEFKTCQAICACKDIAELTTSWVLYEGSCSHVNKIVYDIILTDFQVKMYNASKKENE
jgi:hypothetical protein